MHRLRPRWWPAVLFLALTTVAILWVRFFWEAHQQDKNIWTYLLCGVCFLCLLLWLVVLSNFPWRVRWVSLGLITLVHLVVVALIRIKGVDGNLVPIIEWRWKAPAVHLPESSGLVLHQPLRESADARLNGWPQFLGPNRNCTVADFDLETDWGLHHPVELWRVPIGPAWSGFAVSEGFAVTQEQQGLQEAISCFEARSGRRLWTHSYNARFASTIAGVGPRATPSIEDGRVYAVGATGWVTGLDLRNGQVLWARNIVEEGGASVPEWGFSVSPLLKGHRMILSVGGSEGRSLVALNPLTGGTLWTSGNDHASYSSPILQDVEGQPQVVVFNRGSVAGHDLEDGRLLWEQPYSSAQVHVAAPLALGENRVLFSSGYGHGSKLYAIQRKDDQEWSARLVWESRRMKAKFTNLIEHRGFIYGLDDGILACISSDTGELQWKDGRYGHGQIILVGEALLIATEMGELIMVDPNPEALNERSRFRVFSGKAWNPPALADGHLFLRTDQEAVCLKMP